MIGFETFLFGLLVTSTLTGLTTEGLKKAMTEHNKTCRPNTLAGLVSVVLSVFISTGYVVFTNQTFTPQIIMCLIGQIFMSWLCAMVGYDKVIQSISQFKTSKGDE